MLFSCLESPLALMKSGDSSASKDLTRIHTDLLTGLRIGLLVFEQIVTIKYSFADEVQDVRGKVVPAGEFNGASYRYVLHQNTFPS